METATKSSGFQVTQLTAINVAKIVTILCLITLALIYGVNDYRQVIYLYISFSVIAGELWAFLLLGVITLLYLQRISQGRVESDGTLLCAYHAWRFSCLEIRNKLPRDNLLDSLSSSKE